MDFQASINAAGDGPVVSSIFLVTIIACAAGALVVLAFAKWNTGSVVSGLIAGNFDATTVSLAGSGNWARL